MSGSISRPSGTRCPPAEWPRVAELFGLALALPAAERAAFLLREAPAERDAGVRQEVAELLAAAGAVDGPDACEATTDDAPRPPGAGAEDDPLIGRTVGDFTILAGIAEGGMGVVYAARQASPARDVALKVVRGAVLGPDAAARFVQEAELLGRLQHPGIATIHAAGTFRLDASDPSTQRAFCAMELVRGSRITDHVARCRPSRSDLLLLLALVADAVEHAHRRGIVHRDLKPGNILVDDEGLPKVVDFGIATTIERPADCMPRTRAGEIAGTPGYMAPEQLVGDRGRVGPRSDVYALGVVAYELLSGRLPVDVAGLSLTEALERLRTEEPAPLGALRPDLRGDISTVVACAMAPEPQRRYATAGGFAADLRRIVESRPITARPPSLAYRMQRFVGRNRGASAAGILAAALLLIAVVGTTGGWLMARREAERVRRVNEVLHGVIERLDPGLVGGGTISLERALDEAAALVTAEIPEGEALAVELHELLGERYTALGLHDRAERHWQLAERAAQAAGVGGDPLGRARRLARLANAIAARGDLDRGLVLLEEATALRSAALPPGAIEIAESLHNLSVIRRRRGEIRQALADIDAAVAIVERHQPGRVAELSWSLAQRGILLVDLGEIDAAIETARRALVMRDEIRPDDLATATLLERLAFVIAHDATAPELAGALLERVLRIRRSLLPGNHPEVQTARCALAARLIERRELDAADRLLAEAAEAAGTVPPAVPTVGASVEAEIARLLDLSRAARAGAGISG
ncbi:MAG TPA: serine/threonine-protein kinase [Phycisphaerales bacterium]|nr:serine/threonine-protein kinase [Phycisphaerales bacterium]HMP35865.1 serine/threonine-protein kinase [Phycisphaerales bacterium]